MSKLVLTNFYDPKPDIVNYQGDSGHGLRLRPVDRFNEYLSEWEKRNIKPMMPSAQFTDNSELAWEIRKKAHPSTYELFQDYFKDLDFFNTHRLKYKGFERYNHHLLQDAFSNGTILVGFSGPTLNIFTIEGDDLFVRYAGPILSEQTFDLLMKDLGIKIEKV